MQIWAEIFCEVTDLAEKTLNILGGYLLTKLLVLKDDLFLCGE